MADFVELQPSALGNLNPKLDEKWLQEYIAENPDKLFEEFSGISNVDVIAKERRQPRAGRLDMLLVADDIDKGKRRYTVEIQLGATDASHIIRTIEYWDLERKRYPQYDHCAVIVAEDITSRFFNVIGLFNGYIPIIAIKADVSLTPDGGFGLRFIRILDETRLAQEETTTSSLSSRDEWIANPKKGEEAVLLAEYLCQKLETAPRITRHYIGMDDDRAELRNKVNIYRYGGESKLKLRIDFKMKRTPERDQEFDSGEFCANAKGWAFNDGYTIEVVNKQQIDDNIDLLQELYREAAGIPQTPKTPAAESDGAE